MATRSSAEANSRAAFSLMNENVTHSLKPAEVASRRSARSCSRRSLGRGGTCASAGKVAGNRS